MLLNFTSNPWAELSAIEKVEALKDRWEEIEDDWDDGLLVPEELLALANRFETQLSILVDNPDGDVVDDAEDILDDMEGEIEEAEEILDTGLLVRGDGRLLRPGEWFEIEESLSIVYDGKFYTAAEFAEKASDGDFDIEVLIDVDEEEIIIEFEGLEYKLYGEVALETFWVDNDGGDGEADLVVNFEKEEVAGYDLITDITIKWNGEEVDPYDVAEGNVSRDIDVDIDERRDEVTIIYDGGEYLIRGMGTVRQFTLDNMDRGDGPELYVIVNDEMVAGEDALPDRSRDITLIYDAEEVDFDDLMDERDIDVQVDPRAGTVEISYGGVSYTLKGSAAIERFYFDTDGDDTEQDLVVYVDGDRMGAGDSETVGDNDGLDFYYKGTHYETLEEFAALDDIEITLDTDKARVEISYPGGEYTLKGDYVVELFGGTVDPAKIEVDEMITQVQALFDTWQDTEKDWDKGDLTAPELLDAAARTELQLQAIEALLEDDSALAPWAAPLEEWIADLRDDMEAEIDDTLSVDPAIAVALATVQAESQGWQQTEKAWDDGDLTPEDLLAEAARVEGVLAGIEATAPSDDALTSAIAYLRNDMQGEIDEANAPPAPTDPLPPAADPDSPYLDWDTPKALKGVLKANKSELQSHVADGNVDAYVDLYIRAYTALEGWAEDSNGHSAKSIRQAQRQFDSVFEDVDLVSDLLSDDANPPRQLVEGALDLSELPEEMVSEISSYLDISEELLGALPENVLAEIAGWYVEFEAFRFQEGLRFFSNVLSRADPGWLQRGEGQGALDDAMNDLAQRAGREEVEQALEDMLRVARNFDAYEELAQETVGRAAFTEAFNNVPITGVYWDPDSEMIGLDEMRIDQLEGRLDVVEDNLDTVFPPETEGGGEGEGGEEDDPDADQPEDLDPPEDGGDLGAEPQDDPGADPLDPPGGGDGGGEPFEIEPEVIAMGQVSFNETFAGTSYFVVGGVTLLGLGTVAFTAAVASGRVFDLGDSDINPDVTGAEDAEFILGSGTTEASADGTRDLKFTTPHDTAITYTITDSPDVEISAGNGSDIFYLTDSDRAEVEGNGGDDTFHVTGSSTVDLEGDQGADHFEINAWVSGTIDGGGDDDSANINGNNRGTLWLENIETVTITESTSDLELVVADVRPTIDIDADVTNLTLDVSQYSPSYATITATGQTSGSLFIGSSEGDTITLGNDAGSTVEGHAGNDAISVTGSGTAILAGDGNDMVTVTGSIGISVDLGTGSDTLTVDGSTLSSVDLGSGAAFLDLMDSTVDAITGSATHISVNATNSTFTFDAEGGDDWFLITGGAATVTGGDGVDTFYTTGGTHDLWGGRSGDLFSLEGGSVSAHGGGGHDLFWLFGDGTFDLTGGGGRDTFVLASNFSGNATLTGYQADRDRIEVSQSVQNKLKADWGAIFLEHWLAGTDLDMADGETFHLSQSSSIEIGGTSIGTVAQNFLDQATTEPDAYAQGGFFIEDIFAVV